MFESSRPTSPSFRAEYATADDFCRLLERNPKSLYLLAFLLTADHDRAMRCFAETVADAAKETTVFKEWALSWIKRSLVKKAIGLVDPASSENRNPEGGTAGRAEVEQIDEIDAVTKLAPMERFVFVMSVLERYTNWDCSLLLGCSPKKVAVTRMRALRHLSEKNKQVPGMPSSEHLQVTA